MLKRLGAAVLIGGLFYGTAFYRIELYQPLASLPLHVIHTFLFGFSLWIIAMVIFNYCEKSYAKNQSRYRGGI